MEYGALHLVVYSKGAPGLHDLTLYLRYHQESMHPRQIEPGSFFGFKGDRLFVSRLNVPGIVVASFTRVRPDRIGATKQQDLAICEIVFERRPFDYKPVGLTHAPNGPPNRARNVQALLDDVSYDDIGPARATGDVVLYWEQRLAGDYNNDGEVMTSDIIPVGRRYGYFSTDGLEDAWDRMADGNADLIVNDRDRFLIEEHFGAQLSGYRVYRRPAGAPQGEEVLLRHRSWPLLPFSIHRPVAWDPIGRYGYYFFDSELPRSGVPAQYTYRIVPYDAVSASEGDNSDVELTISVTDIAVQVVGVEVPVEQSQPRTEIRRLPDAVRDRT
jgi:hypothetical protein